jgi:hypothetical protein
MKSDSSQSGGSMIRKQCTRCGRCCVEEVCPVGEELYKTSKPPCPGLKWENNIASCSLVNLASEEMKPVLFKMMGFGIGCDASFTGKTKGVKANDPKAIQTGKSRNRENAGKHSQGQKADKHTGKQKT